MQQRSQRGYVLLVLILFVTLLAIAVTVTLPSVMFEMKREREQELIHRGVQYTRAIQHYVKKFGNYPTTLDQLENTNQIRFLRHRYKDPITGKDFKLLYMQDVQTSFGPGLQGATSVSQLTQGGAGGLGGPQGGPGASTFGGGGFGQTQSGFGGFNGPQSPGGLGQSGFGQSGFGQSSFGQSSFGQSGFGQGGFASSSSNQQQNGQGQNGQNGSDNGSTGNTQNGSDNNGNPNGAGSGSPNSGSSGSSNNQTFGGGPIVGVISTSKDKSIRIFNKKDHYNQWQFVYNPAMDAGGLLTGPGMPQTLAGGVAASTLANGSNGANGQTLQGGQTPGGSFGGQPGGSFGGQPGGSFGGQPGQPGQLGGNQPFGGQPITQTPQMPPEQ
jgi:type II secretory pathway pseudopilin PulG